MATAVWVLPACLLAFGLFTALHTGADVRARASAVPSCGARVAAEYADATQRARKLVKEMMAESDIPGLSAAVAVAPHISAATL